MGCLCVRMHCVGKLEVGGLLRLVCFWFIAFLFLFFCLILFGPPFPPPFLLSLSSSWLACLLAGRQASPANDDDDVLLVGGCKYGWAGPGTLEVLLAREESGPCACLPGRRRPVDVGADVVRKGLACPGGR